MAQKSIEEAVKRNNKGGRVGGRAFLWLLIDDAISRNRMLITALLHVEFTR